MECKHPYFHWVGGVLVCSQCGKPSDSPRARQPIEDKIGQMPEVKIKKPAAKKPAGR